MKKTEKKLVIKIEELPERIQMLDPETISNIFGGCIEQGQNCSGIFECNCCKRLMCKKSHDLTSWICADGNY